MWSYLHYTSLPEPAEGYSQTSCLDLDRLEPSSATSTAGECYSTDKLTAAYIDSLFGTTSAPLERTTRQPETISTDSEQSVTDSVSAADFPVKTLAQQGKEMELPAPAPDYGRNMPELLARLDPLTCSWKTPTSLLDEGLTLCSQTYPQWGIVLHGGLYPLQAWGRCISGNDGGDSQLEIVPMPLAEEGKTKVTRANLNRQTLHLTVYANIYPTPKAHDAKQAVTLATLGRNSLDLTNYCNVYPTPSTGGMRGGSKPSQRVKSARHLTEDEKKQILMGKNCRLNPDWVEWLMGWKIGWTRLQPGDFGTRKSTDCPGSQSNATIDVNG